MKRRNVVMGLILFGLLAISSLAIVGEAAAPPQSGSIAALEAALEQAGFTVQRGEYGFADAIALCNAGVIQTCQGNNVGAPYLAYKLPPAPGQTTPNLFADARGLAFIYHLRADEAILQIGWTPPEAAYFSYQSYLGMRYDPAQKRYLQMFNSLGDSLNNLTIHTSGPKENPFGQPVVILTAADRVVAAAVEAAVLGAGFPADTVNLDVIAPALVHMGLEPGDDLFQFMSRIAVPTDRAALESYIASPGSVILRLTPKEKPARLHPFPSPVLRVRGTGTTEIAFLPAVDALRDAILARYADLEAIEVETSIALPEGYAATQSRINTMGDTRDAAYFSTVEVAAWTNPQDSRRAAAFPLGDDPNEFFIVYGVNHEASGKASYANCAFYGLEFLNGVASVDNRTYKGSAEDYLPGDPMAPYLYAWKVARNANGDLHCTVLPTGPMHYGIGLEEDVIVFFRVYLEAATAAGPAPNELVFDRLIRFRPKTGG